MSKTNYLEDALLNHVLRHTAYTSPGTVYLGLYTVSPSETGGGTEVAGGSYARQPVTFGAPSGGSTSNTADVTFPMATAPWGTVAAFALHDSPTGANILYFADMASPREILTNDQLRFPAGQLTVQED